MTVIVWRSRNNVKLVKRCYKKKHSMQLISVVDCPKSEAIKEDFQFRNQKISFTSSQIKSRSPIRLRKGSSSVSRGWKGSIVIKPLCAKDARQAFQLKACVISFLFCFLKPTKVYETTSKFFRASNETDKGLET